MAQEQGSTPHRCPLLIKSIRAETQSVLYQRMPQIEGPQPEIYPFIGHPSAAYEGAMGVFMPPSIGTTFENSPDSMSLRFIDSLSNDKASDLR